MIKKKGRWWILVGLIFVVLMVVGLRLVPPEYVPSGLRSLFRFSANVGGGNQAVVIASQMPGYSAQLSNQASLNQLLAELGFWKRYISLKEEGVNDRSSNGTRTKNLMITVKAGEGPLDKIFVSKENKTPIRSLDITVSPEGDVNLIIYLNQGQMEQMGFDMNGAVNEGLVRALVLLTNNGIYPSNFQEQVRGLIDRYSQKKTPILLIKRLDSLSFLRKLARIIVTPVSAQSCFGNITCGDLVSNRTCGPDPLGSPCVSDVDCQGTGYTCQDHTNCVNEKLLDCSKISASACMDPAKVCGGWGSCVGYADNNGTLKQCNNSQPTPVPNCKLHIRKVHEPYTDNNGLTVWKALPDNDPRNAWPVFIGGNVVGAYPVYGTNETVQWIPPNASMWPWNEVGIDNRPFCRDVRMTYCYDGPNSPRPCTNIKVQETNGNIVDFKSDSIANSPAVIPPVAIEKNFSIPDNGVCEAYMLVHWNPCVDRPWSCAGAGGYLTNPQGPQLGPNKHQVPTQIIDDTGDIGTPKEGIFDEGDWVRIDIETNDPDGMDTYFFGVGNNDNQYPCTSNMPGYPNCDVPKGICLSPNDYSKFGDVQVDLNLNDNIHKRHRKVEQFNDPNCPSGTFGVQFWDPQPQLGRRTRGSIVLSYDDMYMLDKALGTQGKSLLVSGQLGGYIVKQGVPLSYPVSQCTVELFVKPYCSWVIQPLPNTIQGKKLTIPALLKDYGNRVIVDARFWVKFISGNVNIFEAFNNLGGNTVTDTTPVLIGANVGEYDGDFRAVGVPGSGTSFDLSSGVTTNQYQDQNLCSTTPQALVQQNSQLQGTVYVGQATIGGSGNCIGTGAANELGNATKVQHVSTVNPGTEDVDAAGNYAFSPRYVVTGDKLNLIGFDLNKYKCQCPLNCEYGFNNQGYGGEVLTRDFYVTESIGWWQTVGGDVAAIGSMDTLKVSSQLPLGEYLSLKGLSPKVDSGILLYDGGTYDFGVGIGWANPDRKANTSYALTQSTPNDLKEDFGYFTNLLDMPGANLWPPGADNSKFSSGFTKPAGVSNVSQRTGVYAHQGDLTVKGWAVTLGEKLVIFVNGNLIIENDLIVDKPNGGLEGGFILLIVSGDITLATNTVQGIYVADGLLTTSAATEPLLAQGVFVGWGGVSLGRSLGLQNETVPAELFTYRPDFLLSAPDGLKKTFYNWKEVAP